jgi:hypothetical protein
MNPELIVEAVGKTIIAVVGTGFGLQLLRRWQQTRDRVVLYWAVLFLSSAGYLVGVLIILGRGDPALLTRLHYLTALLAAVLGALAATVLMLPLPAGQAERLSEWLPGALFLILATLALTSPLRPALPGEEYTFLAPVDSIYVGGMMLAGLFSAGTLVFLAARFKEIGYFFMAVAYLLITVGGRMVGSGARNLALSEVVVLAGYVLFYWLFSRLMRLEPSA